ncbi:hypothetical protein BKA83DRAFT_4131346 [Pisolithus microcarpus]|nr:hypothetical protein BKA83DRAFT_4131346 [Pisolithus microcarpus]
MDHKYQHSVLKTFLTVSRSIYDMVICPLLKAWGHPSIIAPIKDVLVAFQPNSLTQSQFIPNLFITLQEVNGPHLAVTQVDSGWLPMPAQCIHHTWLIEQQCQELSYGSSHYKMYEAQFTISLAINNIPADAYPAIPNLSLWIACYAADISLKVYFDDIKCLIQDNMNNVLTPNPNDADCAVRQTPHNQLMALACWIDEPNLLSYNPGVLSNLLQAITDPAAGKFELMPSTLGQMPVTFFAEALVRSSTCTDAQHKPPFIPGGNFLHFTCVTIDEIRSIASCARISAVDQHQFIIKAYCCACEYLKVNHVPWSPNPQHTLGCPSTTVMHDVWLNLSAKASVTPAFSSRVMTSLAHSPQLLAIQASEKIQSSDPCGEWSAVNICLINFASVLHKIKMPVEWDIVHTPADLMPSYIIDSYHFITGKYDGVKPLHQLAPFCAIICAGLLPEIFSPDLTNHPSKSTHFESYVQELGWVKCERRKGTTHTAPVMMVIGFIISLYETNSPIIKAVHSHSDLKHWWSKHTAKAINVFLLVCLSLTTLITGSGFHSAKWLQDVKFLPMLAIKQKHAEVVRLLKTGGKYGGFDAVRYLSSAPVILIGFL